MKYYAVINPFQFHTGSIKAGGLYYLIQEKKKFQFHTGSIKAQCWCAGLHDVSVFQFHTGSIKAISPVLSISIPPLVSIPHWFD